MLKDGNQRMILYMQNVKRNMPKKGEDGLGKIS
jgi:hypothetical protein